VPAFQNVQYPITQRNSGPFRGFRFAFGVGVAEPIPIDVFPPHAADFAVVPHTTVSRNHNYVGRVFGQQWKNPRLRSIVHKQQTLGFVSELEFGTSCNQTVVLGFKQHPAQGSDGTVRVARTRGKGSHFDMLVPDLIHANVFQFGASQKIFRVLSVIRRLLLTQFRNS